MRKVEKMNFNYFIDEYLYNCHSRKLRRKTMESYEQSLRLFERWVKENENITSPAEVTRIIITHYICDLQERGKYSFCADPKSLVTNCPERRRDYRQPVSATTINNYIRNLKAFFAWYTDCYHVRVNPMEKIRQLPNERVARDFMEDFEVTKLLNIFDKSYYSEHRDRTVILLILDSGMRLGECLQLRVEHIDLFENVIEIPAETTKGRKSRSVFFSNQTARTLRQWLRFKDRYVESAYLFPVKASGTPISIRAFEGNFKKYIQRAGIQKQISPHALRNNFAKRCLMSGMDVYTLSRILGHSSVTVTERAYLDLSDRDIRHRYQQFSPIANLK